MNPPPTADIDVLIVGAGPTGLVLALWLRRFGLRILIIDKAAEPGINSRALAVQARTLELYRQIGIADAVIERGRKMFAVNLWAQGKKKAHAVVGEMGTGLSPYPFTLIFSQDEHERLLIERLAHAGTQVDRQSELLGFEQSDECVIARLRRADGTEEVCRARYIAGCDGAHSRVRENLQISFPGGDYTHLFYVADVEATGDPINGELNVGLDENDFLVIFPLERDAHVRLIGTIRQGAQKQDGDLTWNDVSDRVLKWICIDVKRVNWFSTYRVHHRVAEHFRKGAAFLLGDAAHIHSPVGGQGMNTGIGDAVNLAWKLAAVVHGEADSTLLDSYEPERIAFAQRLVATTDRAFTEVVSSNVPARFVRLHVVPLLLPYFFAVPAMRRLMFRIVSQTLVNYRGGDLSEGRAGKIHGGDRLPWVKLNANSTMDDNFSPLRTLRWQVHVYGESAAGLLQVCAARNLQLCVFPWSEDWKTSGLLRDALYLIRPDGYVALADSTAAPATITDYLDKHHLTFPGK